MEESQNRTHSSLSRAKCSVKGGATCYCLCYGGCSYTQPALLSSCLFICLSSSPLSLTYVSQAERARLSVPQNIIYPVDTQVDLGLQPLPELSAFGLREPCSERKASMQKSHFTCSGIIFFSSLSQPLSQKYIESFALGSKLQGIEERKEDLQKI